MTHASRPDWDAFLASRQPRIVGDSFPTEEAAVQHAQERGYAHGLEGVSHNWWSGVPSGWSTSYCLAYHEFYAKAAEVRHGKSRD